MLSNRFEIIWLAIFVTKNSVLHPSYLDFAG